MMRRNEKVGRDGDGRARAPREPRPFCGGRGATTRPSGSFRRGFTLVELLVVIAMLMLLMGSVTSSIMGAQRRAKIAAATTAVKEMTNAILAYENYDNDHELPQMSWSDADESHLAFILGKEKNRTGQIPVLYNAALKGGKILDPWGHPYRVQIKSGTVDVAEDKGKGVFDSSLLTSLAFPNFYRVQPWER